MVEHPKITVFTPTYNRAHLLPRVRQSLLQQNFTDFEWLIVDDGSTDNTNQVVKEWMEAPLGFPIRYVSKTNGGKHTAINLGVQEAWGELFVILDSDDELMPNALELIWNKYKTYKGQNIGGIIGLTSYPDGKIIGTKFPDDEMLSCFADLYYKMGVKGDKSVAFVTEKLKQFPFPEPPGIKFVSELTVWHPLSYKYPVLCINYVINQVEYMAGGLSDSSYKNWYLESLAYTNYYLIVQNIHPFFKYPKIRWSEYVQLIMNSKLVGKNYFNQLSLIDKLVYLIAFPRAFISYLNMKSYVEKNNI